MPRPKRRTPKAADALGIATARRRTKRAKTKQIADKAVGQAVEIPQEGVFSEICDVALAHVREQIGTLEDVQQFLDSVSQRGKQLTERAQQLDLEQCSDVGSLLAAIRELLGELREGRAKQAKLYDMVLRYRSEAITAKHKLSAMEQRVTSLQQEQEARNYQMAAYAMQHCRHDPDLQALVRGSGKRLVPSDL